jgi:hypothetical protein
MPLKGALFAFWLYPKPSLRLGDDVDLLVREEHFHGAIAALGSAGFLIAPGPASPYQRSLRPPAVPVVIDLHRSLFPSGYYRLSTAELFERGCEDRNFFPLPAILPSPYDAYAHLVGHAAAGHLSRLSPVARRDLSLLALRFELDDRRMAEHLKKTGLARAALYTLGCLGPVDSFAERVVEHLSGSGLDLFLAGLAFRIAHRFPHGSAPSQLSSYLTTGSLNSLAGLLASCGWRRVRRSLGVPSR